ncbi:hypothetical protein ACRAWF_42750 [Streptomyces sp. L7]
MTARAPGTGKPSTRPPRSGYAEADPTADVEGLRRRRQGRHPRRNRLPHARAARRRLPRGHDRGPPPPTSPPRRTWAAPSSCSPSAVGGAEDGGSVTARVHPAMIPLSHPLASVRGAYNAVFVEVRRVGAADVLRPRSGRRPRASAVLGDLVAVCRNRLNSTTGPGESACTGLPVSGMGEVVTRYHISLDVADKPACFPHRSPPCSPSTVPRSIRFGSMGKDGESLFVVVTHRASDDAALGGTVWGVAQARHRAGCRQHHAG